VARLPFAIKRFGPASATLAQLSNGHFRYLLVSCQAGLSPVALFSALQAKGAWQSAIERGVARAVCAGMPLLLQCRRGRRLLRKSCRWNGLGCQAAHPLDSPLSWRLREKCHRKTGKSLSPLFSSNPEDKVRITEVVGSNLNARS
jgi:hypothetical protein